MQLLEHFLCRHDIAWSFNFNARPVIAVLELTDKIVLIAKVQLDILLRAFPVLRKTRVPLHFHQCLGPWGQSEWLFIRLPQVQAELA